MSSLQDVLQLVELLSPDLTPELAREVADALLRDTVQELLQQRGVQLRVEDLDPRKVNLRKAHGTGAVEQGDL